MVTTFYPPWNFGGDGIAVQRLAGALIRRGHHVTVVHDVDAFEALSRERITAEPGSDGVKVVSLRSGVGALGPMLTQQLGRRVASGRKLRRVLDGGDFDVIHFHNVSLVGGPGCLSAGAAVKLYTAHEHWLVCPTHVLYRHQREPCPERQCLRCTLKYRRPPQLWRYTGYLERQLRHVDTFIALSEFSRRKHHEFGFPREMEVVPDLLPDAPPPQASSAPPHPRPYFLFVGRLERIKGLDEVIPVFRDRYHDADLLVAGQGPHGPTLERLAAGSARIKFLGKLGAGELDSYYRDAVAVVVPSAGFETFGMTAVEALAASTPVIVRRLGALPEIAAASGAALLFDGPEELASALGRLQSDPELRQRMGEAGYRAFRERWSESAVIPRYLMVVERAARAAGRPRLAEVLAAGSAGA
jgi:glycosyltransferase involved in cell wall biosynthesis